MNQLDIIFGGMCLFTPFTRSKRMFVFLPNLQQPDEQFGRRLSRHVSVIRFRPVNLGGISVPAALTALARLDRVQIEFLPDGRAVSTDQLEFACFDAEHDGHNTDKAGHGAAQCFVHVASLERALAARGLPRPGKIDPRFLKDSSLDVVDAQTLAARVLANVGTIRVLKLSARAGRPILWRFRPFFLQPGPNDHKQVIAAVIALEVPFANFVDLRLTSLLDGSIVGQLRLLPAGAQRIEISILNEEESVVLGSGAAAESPRPWEAREADRIFELYSSLLLDIPDPLEMPIPVSQGEVGGFPSSVIAGGSPPCSPTRSAPVNG